MDEAVQVLADATGARQTSSVGGQLQEVDIHAPLVMLYIYLEKADLLSCLELSHRWITATQTQPSSELNSLPVQSILQFGTPLKVPGGPLSRLLLLSQESAQEGSQTAPAIPLHISTSVGYAITSSLALLMKDYFCGCKLLVPPPTHPISLAISGPHPPLHWLREISALPSFTTKSSRKVELSRSKFLDAIKRQKEVSEAWSPEHALELLLLCGLWQEAAALANFLGDWKKAFLLVSAHLHHLQAIGEECVPREYLSHVLSLQQSLVTARLSHLAISELTTLQGPDPVTPSLSHLLLGCAMAGELDNILVNELTALTDDLVRVCRAAPMLVDRAVPDLPSPPPYCPQPSSTSEVSGVECIYNV